MRLQPAAGKHGCGRERYSFLADEIAEFALAHFFDKNGVLHEFFDEDWDFAPGVPGRIVEPGHQYEWAWLLLRWAGDRHPKARAAALKMIEVTEANCVAHGLALQQVLDDFSPHDPSARLWPQTERLKAGALAARLTGEAKYFEMAASAADRSVERAAMSDSIRAIVCPTCTCTRASGGRKSSVREPHLMIPMR